MGFVSFLQALFCFGAERLALTYSVIVFTYTTKKSWELSEERSKMVYLWNWLCTGSFCICVSLTLSQVSQKDVHNIDKNKGLPLTTKLRQQLPKLIKSQFILWKHTKINSEKRKTIIILVTKRRCFLKEFCNLHTQRHKAKIQHGIISFLMQLNEPLRWRGVWKIKRVKVACSLGCRAL